MLRVSWADFMCLWNMHSFYICSMDMVHLQRPKSSPGGLKGLYLWLCISLMGTSLIKLISPLSLTCVSEGQCIVLVCIWFVILSQCLLCDHLKHITSYWFVFILWNGLKKRINVSLPILKLCVYISCIGFLSVCCSMCVICWSRLVEVCISWCLGYS